MHGDVHQPQTLRKFEKYAKQKSHEVCAKRRSHDECGYLGKGTYLLIPLLKEWGTGHLDIEYKPHEVCVGGRPPGLPLLGLGIPPVLNFTSESRKVAAFCSYSERSPQCRGFLRLI